MVVKDIRDSVAAEVVGVRPKLVFEARSIREFIEELSKEALPLLGETQLFGGERLRPIVASIAQTCSSYAAAVEEAVQAIDGLQSRDDLVFLSSLSYFAREVAPKLLGERSYPATLRSASEELDKGLAATRAEYANIIKEPPKSREEERLRADYSKALKWLAEPRYEPEPYEEGLTKISTAAQTAAANLRQAAVEGFTKKVRQAIEDFSRKAQRVIEDHTKDVQGEEDLAELYHIIKETEETTVPPPPLPAQPGRKQKQESGLKIFKRLRRVGP